MKKVVSKVVTCVVTTSKPETSGYIAIRRELLQQSILNSKNVSNELAYIYLIASAAYQNQGYGETEKKRGDCSVSVKQMAMDFGWSDGQRIYFLRWLKNNRLATIKQKGNHSCITLLHYEKDTLSRTTQTDKAPMHSSPCPTQTEESLPARPFEEIRDLYQRLTHSKATDMVRTLRLWNTLSAKQQTVAVRNLPAYLRDVKDLRYAKRLYNYLADETYILSNEDFLFIHPLPRHETEE